MDGRRDDFISDMVDSAMSSMDFGQLSRDIEDSVQTVFDELGIALNVNISDHIRQQGFGGTASRTASSRVGGAARQRTQAVREKPVAMRNPPGSLSGTILTALGATFTAIFGLWELVVAVLGMTIPGFAAPGALTAGLSLIPLAASVAALAGGIRINGRIKRFRKYMKQIGKRKFCEIKELAQAIGKSDKYVADDLQSMIDKDFFTNAHMDALKTTLMLDEETWQQYLASMNEYEQRMQKEEKDSSVFSQEGMSQELAQALEEGEKYIRQVQEANAAIPGDAFSAKLNRMEELIRQIFAVVRRKPDQLYKLRRFMKYYMPTTVKLLKAYQELDAQPAGETVSGSKKEIEDTVDTINFAYEKLLDSFFEEAAIDISSDISVLQSMFAQEGLGEDPFAQTGSPAGEMEIGQALAAQQQSEGGL